MANRDDLYRSYLGEAQAHVADTVLAVGFLSTAGRTASIVSDAVANKALWHVSPFAAGRQRRRQAAAREATTSSWLVAVTPTDVQLFAFSTDRTGAVRIGGPPTVWLRASFRVDLDAPGRMSQGLHVTFADGTRHDFEVNRGYGYEELNRPMLELLTQLIPA
jgi:hypothetical protein